MGTRAVLAYDDDSFAVDDPCMAIEKRCSRVLSSSIM